MPYLGNAVLLVGAFILIVGVVLGVREFLERRRVQAESFRDYFGPDYDRDLLQQSVLSETEDWLADRQVRFSLFCLREPGGYEKRTRDMH